MSGNKKKTERQKNLDVLDEDSAVLQSMMKTRAKKRATALINLAKGRHKAGRKKVHADAFVSKIRTMWVAAAGMKNISLRELAALNNISIAMARKFVYAKTTYRQDCLVIDSDIPKYTAQLQLVQDKFDSMVKQDLKEIQQSAMKNYTADQQKKQLAHLRAAEKLKAKHTAETEKNVVDLAVGNKNIITREDAYSAARMYLKATDNFNGRALSQLANKIIVSKRLMQ